MRFDTITVTSARLTLSVEMEKSGGGGRGGEGIVEKWYEVDRITVRRMRAMRATWSAHTCREQKLRTPQKFNGRRLRCPLGNWTRAQSPNAYARPGIISIYRSSGTKENASPRSSRFRFCGNRTRANTRSNAAFQTEGSYSHSAYIFKVDDVQIIIDIKMCNDQQSRTTRSI